MALESLALLCPSRSSSAQEGGTAARARGEVHRASTVTAIRLGTKHRIHTKPPQHIRDQGIKAYNGGSEGVIRLAQLAGNRPDAETS